MDTHNDRPEASRHLCAERGEAERFYLRLRIAAGQYHLDTEDAPEGIGPELYERLQRLKDRPLTKEEGRAEWNSILKALEADGWHFQPVISSTVEFSMNERKVVSRIQNPQHVSPESLDVHRSIHDSIAGMFSRAAETLAETIRAFADQSQHSAAVDALGSSDASIVLLGAPSTSLIDSLCLIDTQNLAPDRRHLLLQFRVNEKSRARRYSDLEPDIAAMESEFSSQISNDGKNRLLLIRAEMAEHTSKPERAYACYQELLRRDGLSVEDRAHAHWGVFRLGDPKDPASSRSAELAADAFLEGGNLNRAARCYMSASEVLERVDVAGSLALIDKALELTGTGPLDSELRAGILHHRSGLFFERQQHDQALNDAVQAVEIRRSLSGVEGELIASLHLARIISYQIGKSDAVATYEMEIAALKSRADRETLLRERLSQAVDGDANQLKELLGEVRQVGNTRLVVETEVAYAVSTMNTDFPGSLGHLDSALELASNDANVRRDLELIGLVQSTMGQVYLLYGFQEKAQEWFKRAVANNPLVEPARRNLAALLMKNKNWADLVEFADRQIATLGESPSLLYARGRGLMGLGRPAAAAVVFHRAKGLGGNEPLLSGWIDIWLGRALSHEAGSDPILPAAKQPASVSRSEFEAAVASFVRSIQTEHRMSFWITEEKKKKFVPSPEQHAKKLMQSFLRGRLGDEVIILDEIVSGAGLIDLWIQVPGGARFIVELKMCGNSYSTSYALSGIEQLQHYMANKGSHLGYLIVFDARRRDYGKGIERAVTIDGNTIRVEFVDIRPEAKASDADEPDAA